MYTYQDWLKYANKSEDERMAFIQTAINDHKSSPEYSEALAGEDYYAGRNTTIIKYEKVLYNAFGQAVPDVVSANHKIATRFFYRDVTQANAVLLGNGIKWKGTQGEKALGKDFDRKIITAGRNAQVQGKAFGFYNDKKVDIFKLTEFKPFFDEEDGALKAGIRFWQLAPEKPMRATVYELDGYTEYRFTDKSSEVIQPKRTYIVEKKTSVADGEEIYDFQNYPTFPIVPLYSNDLKMSELTPLRAKIDAKDLISSGYANDVDDANIIYWTINNAGGMDDMDLVQTIDKLRKIHAAQTDSDQTLTPNQVEAPYASREACLDRLEKELYMDAMAFNPYDIASGAATATQIEAAYDPLDEKLDIYESHISEFIAGLLQVADVEDEPTYERNYHTNKTEVIGNILNGASYLDDEYVTEKLMTLMGDKDKIEEVKKRKAETDIDRLAKGKPEEEEVNGDQEGEQEV